MPITMLIKVMQISERLFKISLKSIGLVFSLIDRI